MRPLFFHIFNLRPLKKHSSFTLLSWCWGALPEISRKSCNNSFQPRLKFYLSKSAIDYSHSYLRDYSRNKPQILSNLRNLLSKYHMVASMSSSLGYTLHVFTLPALTNPTFTLPDFHFRIYTSGFNASGFTLPDFTLPDLHFRI